MTQVTHDNLFETLMRHHVSNLQQSLPHFNNGQILDKDNTSLEHGENPYYKGLYLIYDGDHILEKASSRFVRQSAQRETTYVPTQTEFLQTIAAKDTTHKKAPDVVYLYNTTGAKLTRLKGELSNYHPTENLDNILQRCLPADFESPDGSLSIYDVGTKTANAVLTAYALNRPHNQGVHTIIIKKTPYGSLGMGKLAEFGKDGLTREFYFEHAPHLSQSQVPFIDPAHKIVGIYKEYTHPLQPTKTIYLSPSDLSLPTQRALHTSPRPYSTTPTDAMQL